MTAKQLIKALQKFGNKALELDVKVYDKPNYIVIDDAKITTEENDFGIKESFIELITYDSKRTYKSTSESWRRKFK